MLSMKFESMTKEDFDDMAHRVQSVGAIARVMTDREFGNLNNEECDEDMIDLAIFEGIEILIKPVFHFFYSADMTVTEESDDHEEPEDPAKE
jgi:hypothetical protein